MGDDGGSGGGGHRGAWDQSDLPLVSSYHINSNIPSDGMRWHPIRLCAIQYLPDGLYDLYIGTGSLGEAGGQGAVTGAFGNVRDGAEARWQGMER